jgi:hypothetical protein
MCQLVLQSVNEFKGIVAAQAAHQGSEQQAETHPRREPERQGAEEPGKAGPIGPQGPHELAGHGFGEEEKKREQGPSEYHSDQAGHVAKDRKPDEQYLSFPA